MFENPEKLFIIFVIALLIFGPSKLAGMGATIGRTIREFRNAVRGAQETFSMTEDSYEPTDGPATLPDPGPQSGVTLGGGATSGETGSVDSWTREEGTVAVLESSGGAREGPDDLSSLVSEPTAHDLRESFKRVASGSG